MFLSHRLNDDPIYGIVYQKAVILYQKGCIELDPAMKFCACSDYIACSLRDGEPCTSQKIGSEIATGMNDVLSIGGHFLLVRPTEAQDLIDLIENGSLKFDAVPLPNRMHYYLARKARNPGNYEITARFNDALAVLIAQGWEAGYSPDLIKPILIKIADM